MTGVLLGVTLAVKLVGLFITALIGIATITDLVRFLSVYLHLNLSAPLSPVVLVARCTPPE